MRITTKDNSLFVNGIEIPGVVDYVSRNEVAGYKEIVLKVPLEKNPSFENVEKELQGLTNLFGHHAHAAYDENSGKWIVRSLIGKGSSPIVTDDLMEMLSLLNSM